MIDEWIRTGLLVLSLLFSVGTFVYGQIDRRNRATVKSINDLRESVDQRFVLKCERLSRLEGEVNRIPTRAEFDAAQARMESVVTRVHERIDDLTHSTQQSAKDTNLLLGQVLGQLKQINKE